MYHIRIGTKAGIVFLSLSLSSLIAAAQQEEAVRTIHPHAPQIAHYAEDLYSEYSAGSTSEVSFKIETTTTGPMLELAGRPFASLIVVPTYRILTDQRGTGFKNARFSEAHDPNFGLHDMPYTADRFADFGLPLEDGTYRRLLVSATIGSDTRTHQAIEFCWNTLQHCAVLDPTVFLLQSKVDTRLRLAAEGWGPRVAAAPAFNATSFRSNAAVVANAGTCGLASHHSWKGETITWPPYTETAKDIFGITLWQMNLAQQIDGISCDTSCRPLPSTTSGTSSAFGNLGYSTACANRGASGVTGSGAKSIAETYCTEELIGNASASVTVNGSGASIGLAWHLGGSSYSNGGTYTDSCGYF